MDGAVFAEHAVPGILRIGQGHGERDGSQFAWPVSASERAQLREIWGAANLMSTNYEIDGQPSRFLPLSLQ